MFQNGEGNISGCSTIVLWVLLNRFMGNFGNLGFRLYMRKYVSELRIGRWSERET
jgi:hypothetical protein